MMTSQPLDLLPIWGIYVFIIGILLLGFEAGYRANDISIMKFRMKE